MKKSIILFLCSNLCVWISLSQNEPYYGGSGDGFALASVSVTTLTNDDLSVLYQGGAGDGFTYVSNGGTTTLNNTDLSILYKGGSGDGFAYASNGGATTLNNTDLSILYKGGSGDGFAFNTSDSYILNDFPRIKLAIKIILQGAYLNPNTGEETLMRDNLRTLNLLPTTSPYSDGVICNSSVFNNGGSDGNGAINDDIVDWVLVEIRNSTDNTIVESSKSALLQRDGDVVDIDGISPLVIYYSPGDYYVAVKHRNHLGVMTAISAYLSPTVQNANFINSSFNVYGTYSRININGKMALWAGDANNNGSIEFSGINNDSNTIRDTILADTSNALGLMTFISNDSYSTSDLNMDGEIKYSGAQNDSNISKDNIMVHPSNTSRDKTFTITQQIPNN